MIVPYSPALVKIAVKEAYALSSLLQKNGGDLLF